MPAGDTIIRPRGMSHTFWNAGPQPARLLEVIAPAGFEASFEETDIPKLALLKDTQRQIRRHDPVGRIHDFADL